MIEQKSDLILVRKLATPPSSPRFVLCAPFLRGDWIVPAGFDTDLASIPRIFQPFISKLEGVEAAVLHDWFYRFKVVPRAQADRIFLEAMEGAVPWWKRRVMWLGVRAGGWLSYQSE